MDAGARRGLGSNGVSLEKGMVQQAGLCAMAMRKQRSSLLVQDRAATAVGEASA